MAQNLERRKLIRRGCLTALAAGVVLCGGGTLVLALPPRVDRPKFSTGGAGGERVLVAYGTKAGATGEMALRIGKIIAGRGPSVDVLPIDQVGDPSDYSAVVLGSAIRVGAPLPVMVDYLKAHQTPLSQVPFSSFITCMTLTEKTPEARSEAHGYLAPVREIVMPAAEGLFAGAVFPERLPLYERLMLDAMKSPKGDFRDWSAVEDWAASVPVK